jgi:mannosyltransferase
MGQEAEPAAPPSRTEVTEHVPARAPGGWSPAWLALIPAVLTLGVTLYRIQGPSITEDEDATLLAIHRTFPQLVHLLGRVDVVHGTYYSLIWAWSQVFGTGELAVRFPSAVAMALAAGGVTLLGQRLVSPLAGLAAGLVFTALPSVSWFAEDARDYALVTLVAVVASYLFIRALESGPRRRRWLIGYGVALLALGLANLFALLIIPAHALALASRIRRNPGIRRGLVSGWLLAVVAALIVVSPVAVTGYQQMHQVGWIPPVKLRDVFSVMRVAGSRPLFYVMAGIIIVVVVAGAIISRGWVAEHWPEPLVALTLPWLVLPPAVLLLGSLAHPVYTYRYIAFCIPALALLMGVTLAALSQLAGPAWLGRVAAVAGLIAVLAVGLPLQGSERGSDGHGFDIREIDQTVAQYRHRDDAVFNITANHYERELEIAYPYGLRRLRDVTAGASPAASGTMGGTYASLPVIRQRLAGVHRVWAVGGTVKHVPLLEGLGFHLFRHWYVTGVYIRLYVKEHAASTVHSTARAGR